MIDAAPSYLDRMDVLEDKTIAEIFMHYLETMGMTHVFGVPGGAIAPYLKLLRKSQIKFIIGCHEAGSAFMADGFARMTGKPGIVFVTSGPGATNAITGVACAHAANSPVLLFSGQASTAYFHMGSIQESTNDGVNIVEMFRHSCGMSELVSNSNSFRGALFKAGRVLMGLPRSAVHLSLPLDVSSTKVERMELPKGMEGFSTDASYIDERKMAEALKKLMAAKRPLIFLGSGCRQALRSPRRLSFFMEFVSAQGIPVVTSAQAKGIFPESHLLSLGVYGISGSEQANAYVKEGRPDVLLVIGSSLGEWSTKSWEKSLLPTEAFIQVDINPKNLGRTFPITDGVVGDAGACLDYIIINTLAEASPFAHMRQETVEKLKSKLEPFNVTGRDSEGTPVKPQRLMKELVAVSDEKTSFFVDSGNCMSWAINHLSIDPPAEFFVTTSVASMGWAVGAVIGAKLAAPERTCICITGDGSLLMNGSEILTASRYKAGVVYVVLNDNCLGMVNQGEAVTSNHEFSMTDGYYDLGDPDLVKFSRSLGAKGYLVESSEDLGGVLREAIKAANQDGCPQAVVVKIDSKELPPILNRFKSLMKQTATEVKA